MNKQLYISILLLAGIVQNAVAQDTLAYWGFNETTGGTTKEAITKTDFAITSKWPVIERVDGVKQKALRSDGYTVFVEGSPSINYPVDFFSLSFWLALETFPVNTAAVWSAFDPATNKGAYVGVDRFGRLSVTLTVTGQVITFTSKTKLEHYKWSYLAINVDAINGTCKAYLNKAEIISENFTPGGLTWSNTKTYLGRKSTTEKQDIFPLNYLNGIYDEIVVRRTLLTSTQIAEDYAQFNPSNPPALATPTSRFVNDFHRPKYHPIPQSGWANESHGLIYHEGVYHMFFQKNGNGPFFSQQNWGHLTSPDLITWEERQPALFPQPGWESVGTWSGHLVRDNAGIPTIIYTAVDGIKAGIGSAQSTADLLKWERHPSNPLIASSPVPYPNRDFRDPYVFKEGNTWYMIIGSGLQSPSTGTVFLYKSSDLVSWQLIRPLLTDQAAVGDVGIFWEMPVFWKFGNRYMLLVNKTPQGPVPARAFYWVGDFTNQDYVTNGKGFRNLDIINSLLSPSVNLDAENRVTAIGIIPDLLAGSEQYENGWAHIFSLPRVWRMENDSLYQSPHPNIDSKRKNRITRTDLSLNPSTFRYLNVRGLQAEIRTTIYPGTASKVGFVVGMNENNTEFTKIFYDYSKQSFVVDRTKSSINPNTPRDIQTEAFLLSNQPIDWHVYIDGSVVEVFINNKWAFATRIFPVSMNSNIIELFAEGGNAMARDVQIWNMGDLFDVTTGIFSPPQYETLKVYPVPAKDRCNIQLPVNSAGKAKLDVFDVTGRSIKQVQQSISSSNLLQWDLKDRNGKKILPGMYYGLITVNNRKAYQVKIIVGEN